MSDEKDPLANPGHLFDQTNGMAEGLEGDSDGTADSDEASVAERGADGGAVSSLVTERSDDR